MNASFPPVRTLNPFAELDALDDAVERVWCPMGHDAPKHSVEGANFRAALIASREVRGRAIHSAAHRESVEAWERGERSWPWPDPTPAEREAADGAVRNLVRGHLAFGRSGL